MRKCLNKSTKKEVGLPVGVANVWRDLKLHLRSRLVYSFDCSNISLPVVQVAVKFVSKKMQKKEQVAHEADVLLHVQNHQLVALLDTYESPTCLMLVLEL